MQIVSYGLGSIGVIAKQLQQEARVVVDPFENAVGPRFPRTLEAELVLSSHDAPEANNVGAIEGKPFVVNVPGEYEVAGVFVYGISAPKKDGTPHQMFLIESEGVRVAHLGAIDRPLTNAEVTALGDVDVLCVPVGGGVVLDALQAADTVQTIEPRVAIPVWYGECKLPLKALDPKAFIKALGGVHVDAGSKWKITRSTLPEEELQIVTLA